MSRNPPKPMVALTIDDHPLIRAALGEVLREQSARVELLEAADPEAGWALLRARPDVDLVLLDLSFSGEDGVAYIERFRASAPAAPVIVYTMRDEPAVLREALRRGAAAIVPKTHSPELLRKAIAVVMEGGVYVPAELLRTLAAGGEQASEGSPQIAMSPQQWRIVELLAQGLPNKEIGRKLGIASSTVKNQLTTVFGRLGVSNRTQAAMAAGALIASRVAPSKSLPQSGT